MGSPGFLGDLQRSSEKILRKEKQVKIVEIQTGREVRARLSGQGIIRLSYRLDGAWFYVDALVLSKKHSGPGTLRTFIVFAHLECLSFFFSFEELCLIGTLSGLIKPKVSS